MILGFADLCGDFGGPFLLQVLLRQLRNRRLEGLREAEDGNCGGH